MEMLGNAELWKLPKAAFLCSRKVPAAQVLKCYDWAIAMRESAQCVMLGAHSQLEKDVLHYLLKGTQPVVVVLARGLKKKIDPLWQGAVDKGRLLIVSPFEKRLVRVTLTTAAQRNQFMLECATSVVIGHASPGGGLDGLLTMTSAPIVHL